MNQLAVISEAGPRKAEFYGDFIELCPGAGWQSLGRKGISSGMKEGTTIYRVFPVCQVIYPSGKLHECCFTQEESWGVKWLACGHPAAKGRPRLTPKSGSFPDSTCLPGIRDTAQWTWLGGRRRLYRYSPCLSSFNRPGWTWAGLLTVPWAPLPGTKGRKWGLCPLQLIFSSDPKSSQVGTEPLASRPNSRSSAHVPTAHSRETIQPMSQGIICLV